MSKNKNDQLTDTLQLRKTQLYLNAVLESSKDAIVLIIDNEYRYVSFNKVHQNVMKHVYGSDISIGLNILDCITVEEDKEKAKNNYDRALSGEVHSVIEKYGDSEQFYFESVFKPIYDDNKSIIGATAFAHDITEKKRAEEKLRETNATHLAMIANISDVIGIIGSDNIMKYISPNIERFFGWKPEDFVGGNGWRTVHPEDVDSVHNAIEKVLKEKDAQATIEYRSLCKNGTYTWVKLTAFNCLTNPAINGVLLNYHDISEHKEAVRALRSSEGKYKSMFENLNSSSSLYETILDKNGNPVDYRFLAVNPAYEKSIGLKASFLIGKTLLEVFPQTEALWMDTINSAVLTNSPFSVESYAAAVDKWFEITVYVPEKGKMAMIGSDVTERKKAELELADEKERLTVTLRSIGDGVITTDSASKITMLNKAAEVLTGWTSDEAIGRPLLEVFNIINETTKEQCKNPADLVISNGSAVGLASNTMLITKNRKEISIADSGSPLRDKEGNIIGVVLVFRDITEEQNVRHQKEVLTEKLHQSQKMEAIGQLAGGIAHDFSNSIGGIMCAAELLEDVIDDKKERSELIKLILAATDRAGNLSKKLLLFSRKGNAERSAVDVTKIVTETVDLLNHVINRNITISVENKTTFSTIIGDNTLLQNAIMNIAINAGHAMPDGGKLTFSLQNTELDREYCDASPFELQPGEYVEIAIRDTGYGMTPEIQSHIFEPFFTTKELGKGTGLGLSTVYGTVLEHNGAITVYSEVGTGTVFHLYFMTTRVNSSPEEKEKVISGSGTILLIDDESLIRTTASIMLRSLGYRVICAENGLVGVQTFEDKQDEIDLIILDMIMPVMGGREALAKVISINPQIPVIISSGFMKDSEMEVFKNQNVSGFLDKPFRRAKLSELVAKALSSKPES